MSSNPNGLGPNPSGSYEDKWQGPPAPQPPYGQQPSAPYGQPSGFGYGGTSYEQPTSSQPIYDQPASQPYGQPSYGQLPYTQQQNVPALGYGQHFAGGLSPNTAVYISNQRPSVTMVQAVKLWLKNWNNFTGRASRSEFWWMALVLYLGLGALEIVLGFTAVALFAADNGSGVLAVTGIGLYGLSGLIDLAVLVPQLSLGVRRLHDTNQSGWMYLIVFIPFVGPLILLILMALASNPAGARFDDATRPVHGLESL